MQITLSRRVKFADRPVIIVLCAHEVQKNIAKPQTGHAQVIFTVVTFAVSG